jgi:hypothetical protein
MFLKKKWLQNVDYGGIKVTTYQMSRPSSNSIGWTKKNDDGTESWFILFILPETDGATKLSPIIVVDGEIQEERGFLKPIEPDSKKVISEFYKWGPDAPMECAHEIGSHLGRYFRTPEVEKEKSTEAEAGTEGLKLKHTSKKERD